MYAKVATAETGSGVAASLRLLLPSLRETALASAEGIHAGQADKCAEMQSSAAPAAPGTPELIRRRAQAAVISSRFMAKLRGCTDEEEHASGKKSHDGDINGRQLSVSEQVSVLIQQAISLDNLARMYEGWSAWI